MAVHLAVRNDSHEVYLICEDVDAAIQDLESRNVGCTPVADEGWGLLTRVALPGGGTLGLYQPRHPVAYKAHAA